jgi:hypothetical protein
MQRPVDLSADYFTAGKAKVGRVGVAMVELPKPDTNFPGAHCLLCLAAANAMHMSLSKEVQTFSTQELLALQGDLAATLTKQGLESVVIKEPLRLKDYPDLSASETANRSRKDFSAVKSKYQVDRLLLVDVNALGVWRSFSAYVPTDVPRAVMNGSASMIDLSSHALEWYMPLSVSRAAEGEWDEPPKFPGLSNAYYQVIETGMDMIKQPLIR